MNFSDWCRPRWLNPLIAISAAVCVLVGVLGYGLVKFELGAAAQPPAVSAIADDIDRSGQNDAPSSSTETVGDVVAPQRAVSPRLRSSPTSHWSPPPVPRLWYRLGLLDRAETVTSPAGRELLTQFCISQR